MATGCFCVFPAAAVAVSEMKEEGGGGLVAGGRELITVSICRNPLCVILRLHRRRKRDPPGCRWLESFTHTPGAAGEALHVSRLYAKKREKKDNATR